MEIKKASITLFIIAIATLRALAQTGSIQGTITDKTTGETLIGAAVVISGTNNGITSDLDGNFSLRNVKAGTYILDVSYISYAPKKIMGVRVDNNTATTVNIVLESVNQQLEAIVVTATKKTNTEVSMINSIKASQLIVSGISSQQITKTQDKDASEVVRRIPGISIIDGKFIVIRGLSQRYNNVWLNGSAVPSSEADSRAFSFDMIPSSQLDNITVLKSPAPEFPADFSGGFVEIVTKDVAESNSLEFSYGTGFNDQTLNKAFKIAPKGNLDFLGFDDGTRSLATNVPYRLNNDITSNGAQINDFSRNGLNNQWSSENFQSLGRPDQRFSLTLDRRYTIASQKKISLSLAGNYSHTYKALHNMENALIGSYDIINDRPNYFFKYVDNQYNVESKIGGMFNLSYVPNNSNKLQFRNNINQLGRNRLTERSGEQFNSGYYQEKQEFLYTNRLTYTSQLSGNHDINEIQKIDWNLGYSLSQMNQPDRRTISRDRNINDLTAPLEMDLNDTKRLFVDLQENIFSGAANYQIKLNHATGFNPTIKAGFYGELKNRNYDTRSFYYILNSSADPLLTLQPTDVIFSNDNIGINGVYLFEDTRNTDNYKADNQLVAGYLGINIPINRLNIYGGVRIENNQMGVTKYISMDPTNFETKRLTNNKSDIFPSLNTTFNVSERQIVRLAYGATINRPEFRELSPSTYYDFELFSFVKGNENLKTAYVQNIDLRYEFYPKTGEMVTVALFYKNFENPIESTYYENAGGYTYSFTNAKSANNIGAELDFKKDLDVIGLKNFSLSVNAAYINSKVKFDDSNTLEHSRPMQGQSPYLINTGLFYQNEKLNLSCGLLYNVIGERIVGVGRRVAGNSNISVPDIYERPRNLMDFTFNVKVFKRINISGAVKNLLNQSVELQQTATYTDANGASQTRNQTKLKYNPGRNFSISLALKF
ncbi:TonB-dependent receptor [Williamwhitmania taraxaci]|uniref:TonB-dependent receptor n=1 Tax=Williamwhitmania taraxaci TaxID=1640674 RepID=A0A1G6NDY7_9BACT|nr:TonB-dependent receptor [Williamwhitmania taraxaci]SDC66012.1 TonB-dependent receptor [Williamwhitmania taraxaci]